MIIDRLFCVLILLFFNGSAAQLAVCGDGMSCVLLSKCPSVLKIAKTAAHRVRQSICGFENKNSKVCCAVEVHEKLNIVENLLPTKCGMPKSLESRIAFGAPAPIGAFPWMAILGYKGIADDEQKKPQFLCAGSLISSRYILTAAHCIDERGAHKLSVIHLGDYDVSTDTDCQMIRLAKKSSKKCAPPHIVVGFEKVIMHPEYNRKVWASDIGLIRLNISIDFENTKAYVGPVCLPPKDMKKEDLTLDDTQMIAAGWGFTEDSQATSEVLRAVSMSLVESDKCQDKYPNFHKETQLCIGGIERKDTCQGDSGGPIVMGQKSGPPFVQIGIVSYGHDPCALPDTPSVYTSVIKYRDWIIENSKLEK